jgi:cell fate regulator YaaT (PSP1 superfamily)
MKLIDVRFSFDGGKIIFAFTSRGRVDFRDLVRDLTHKFQKSIRLQQVNVREEARVTGDVGPCGRTLCCKSFLDDVGNITLEKAQNQQIVHWGPDRLSGVCGRLKCCLEYEDGLYQELAKNLPVIGRRVKTDSGSGEVIGWHILKQSVDVRLDKKDAEDGRPTIIEVPIKK